MDSPFANLIPSGSQDYVGWEDAPFLARLTGVYTPTSGNQANLHLYSFIEQIRDPVTGYPLDCPGGRQTYPAWPSAPQTTYAMEVNNTLVSVPTYDATGFGIVYPYVWLRLSSYVAGVPVYEFVGEETLLQFVEVSTQSQTTILLPDNVSTLPVYLGRIATWNERGGGWELGLTVWFLSLDGATPALNTVYPCRFLGYDNQNGAIWAGMPFPQNQGGIQQYGVFIGQITGSNYPNPISGTDGNTYYLSYIWQTNYKLIPDYQPTQGLLIWPYNWPPIADYYFAVPTGDYYTYAGTAQPLYVLDHQYPIYYGVSGPAGSAITTSATVLTTRSNPSGSRALALDADPVSIGSLPAGSTPVISPPPSLTTLESSGGSAPIGAGIYVLSSVMSGVAQYQGATGTDGAGTQFVSGLAVAIGTSGGGGTNSIHTYVDDGSFW